MPTVLERVSCITAELEARADPVRAAAMARYMKTDLPFHGVPRPALDRVVRDALVRWPLFGFSTEVHPVTRADLAAGRFLSTGGTHIACVARHLVESRLPRAVVITDGDVQEIPSALAERLRRAKPRVRVGLLDGCNGSFCARLGWPITRMPALDRPTP